MTPFPRRRIVACSLAALVQAACGSDGVAPIPQPSVTVTLASDTLVSLGATTQATAAVANADPQGLVWTSTDEDVASVDQSGEVTAHTSGTAEIRASVEGTSGGAVLVVEQRPDQLDFATEPGVGSGGAPFAVQPVVEARDAEGNLLEGSGPTVILAIGTNPGGGILAGTTEVALEEGVAAFQDLAIDRIGTGYTLVATVAQGPSAQSAPFDVELGPPSPDSSTAVLDRSRALADDTLTVAVELRDAGGNAFTTGGNLVSFALSGGNSGLEILDVLDNADGTYLGRLVATAAGSAVTIEALVEDEPLTGDPLSARVHALESLSAGGWQSLPDSTLGATCGLLDTDELLCWGDGRFGNLGHGAFAPAPDPMLVAGEHVWQAVSSGQFVTCGLTTDASVFCWGAGGSGELGNGESGSGSMDNRSTPTAAQTIESFQRVKASLFRGVCAVAADGRAFCWGPNAWGRLGTGDEELRDVPTAVVGDLAFGSVGLGVAHGCGVTTGGEAYCWGSNLGGTLGTGGPGAPDDCDGIPCALTPIPVTGDLSFLPGSMTLGGNLSCAIEQGTSHAHCWGSGAVGDGSQGPAFSPTPVVGGLAFSSLAANDGYVCGLTTGGSVHCWGTNEGGRLGSGDQADALTPVPIDSSDQFVEISTGPVHACAVTVRGSAYCWGRNDSAELGDGSTLSSPSPVRVRLFRD